MVPLDAISSSCSQIKTYYTVSHIDLSVLNSGLELKEAVRVS